MSIPPTILHQLAIVLAELYPDEGSIRAMAMIAGLNLPTISVYPKALATWISLLTEADAQNRMLMLLKLAKGQYPVHEPLHNICQTYTNWVTAARADSDEANGNSTINKQQLFILYSEVNENEFVRRLRKDLQLLGIPIISNHGSAQPDAYHDDDAGPVVSLHSSSAVLVLMTPDSANSRMFERQWQQAITRKIPVIPLVVTPCNLPPMLSPLSPVDFTSEYELGLTSLVQRLSRLDADRADYLRSLRQGYLEVQEASASPERFDYEIAQLNGALQSLELSPAEVDLQLARQQARVEREINLQCEQWRKERKQSKAKQRVVGKRLMDTSSHFFDRVTQQQEIRSLLAESGTKMISVIGPGGIGKTAVVAKILNDLESGKFLSTAVGTALPDIVYLSTRSSEFSLQHIFLECKELLGGTEGDTLLEIWDNPRMTMEDKAARLLDMLKDRIYIFILDDIDDLLDGRQQFRDASLQSFLDVTLCTPSNVKLVLTTRKGLAFSGETMHFDTQVEIRDGLPVEDGIAMLRALDPGGGHGLRTADEAMLQHAVQKVHGVPRALEIINSIMAHNAFTTLEELLQQDEIFHHKEFVQELVQENYGRLDENSRRVLDALAVFGCPIPEAAVAYLLEPFEPSISVHDVLTRLIETHTVSYNRGLKLVWLHPIDRDFIYSQIPD